MLSDEELHDLPEDPELAFLMLESSYEQKLIRTWRQMRTEMPTTSIV